ncbi:MAG: gamma-glutamyltransferase family protein [Planctomycetota bacterium]|nr:gamma-glutamyltransferase family protein [Planctomycetota bacterium]
MSDFDWTFPYSSQRMPVAARNVVATSQPLAAQAGLHVLREGGNAADAAVATAITLTVVEPTSNGIGSDAFTIIHKDGELFGLNASGRSPRALSPSQFAGMEEMPRLGWGPVTVPGAVSAWIAVSQRFGRLPLKRLFEPAIEYARKGFLVSPQTAESWGRAARIYEDFPEWQRTFAPGGRAPEAGERFACEAQAQTLEKIAASKGEAFYQGELAERIAAASKAQGGAMTGDDLASHECLWVDPISIDYRGFTLHEIPPNGQGLAALLMLGIIRHFPLGDLDPDCPDTIHLQIEVMKVAFADAHRYIADPEHMDVDVAHLLDDSYLQSRAKLIDPDRAQDFKHGDPRKGGTVLLCAADADGCMVSFIQSNYAGFGSGVVIPGTGIAMQNRGACFTLEEGHPNRVGGAKRPYHTIIPAFVTRDGEPVMAFGVMGGAMQPQGHGQVMIRLADYDQNPQAALDAPRWQVAGGMKVRLEPGFSDEVYDTLRRRGHDLEIDTRRWVLFGGGQAIYRLEDGYLGASDLRRDGQAVGF